MAKSTTIELPKGTKVPNHVVIMPDGDRRWARAKGLSASEGHKAGMKNMIHLARTCRDWGIHTVSAWGLSTENWTERPKEEVDFLMNGIAGLLDELLKEMQKDGVRLIHLGRKDRLPDFLMKRILHAEEVTKNNTKHIFNVALDYNGWDEIVRATQKIKASHISADDIDRKLIDSYMDTAGQPYPYIDLYIRTSGEQRTSGFMMWQADYAEFYWEEEYFPAFTPEKLRDAVLDYSRRRRRFGGNDHEEHLKFDPKIAAGLEVAFRKNLSKEAVIKYVKEQYGLSKQLALDAGTHMYSALKHGEQKEWESAKKSLTGLYEVVKRNLGLAFEPELIANFEVNLWKDGGTEEKYREYFAEKFRVSEFQATKTAHLAYLAQAEVLKRNWDKARGYMEKYYQALKERVA